MRIGWTVMVLWAVGTAPAAAAEYQQAIVRAENALHRQQYSAALTHIRQAHFADPDRSEPFLLLSQIPTRGDYQRSARHYYDMAVAYYLKRDFRNARFFFASSYHLNPRQTGVWQTLVHVDAVLSGHTAALTDERSLRRLGNGVSIEASPVVVGGRRSERIQSGGYAVHHPPEINTILSKYGAASTDRQSKIDAAWQDVRRRQGRRPQGFPGLRMNPQDLPAPSWHP